MLDRVKQLPRKIEQEEELLDSAKSKFNFNKCNSFREMEDYMKPFQDNISK
jgi:hypothetical protein